MSTFGAANLITRLSFIPQSRLLSLPWLKSNVVRCFSHKGGGPQLPSRYIPKKFRDVSQAPCSSSEDKSPKDAIRARTSSRNDQHGHNKTLDKTEGSRRSRIDHEQSNVSFNDANEVNEDIKRSGRVVENKYLKTPQEVVEYVNMLQQAGQELKNFEDASNQENNDGIIDAVCMEVLEDGEGLGYASNQVNSCDYEFADSEYVEMPEEDVEEAQYSGGKQEKSNTLNTKQAEKVAIELLAKRAYTIVELRKKLNGKNFPVKVVDAVVSDFQNRGLINDSLYAEAFCHSRFNSSSWGPRRIKQALVKKGVSKGKVEKAVKLVFEDDEDCDQRSSIRLSNSSLQKLYEQASKQWQRSQSAPHEKRKARLIRWLQYRGFDWGVISFILKKLQV